MPPVTPPQIQREAPTPIPQKKGGVGATVGIIIIVVLLIIGGLYFWGARLNAQMDQQPLPLIPDDSSVQ